MAESVTNTDFEDVLKSIRKLVADDTGIPEEEMDKRKQAAKLLLTADFRVPDSAESGPLALGEPLMSSASAKGISNSDAASKEQNEGSSQTATDNSSLEHTITELEAVIAKQDSDQEPDDNTANQPDGDFSMMDEDALRDMISDIVRQELKGDFGDKITRKLRKLVRREINLALAAQDFK